MATHDDATSRLRVALRAGLRTGAATVTLTAADAQLLLGELGRLQQGSDRLRRQNRRLRRRLLAALPGVDLGADAELVAAVDSAGADGNREGAAAEAAAPVDNDVDDDDDEEEDGDDEDGGNERG